jgi:hypothetical protein
LAELFFWQVGPLSDTEATLGIPPLTLLPNVALTRCSRNQGDETSSRRTFARWGCFAALLQRPIVFPLLPVSNGAKVLHCADPADFFFWLFYCVAIQNLLCVKEKHVAHPKLRVKLSATPTVLLYEEALIVWMGGSVMHELNPTYVVAEYNALRAEILKRVETRYTLLSITLTALAALLTFGAQTNRAILILLYPILALCLAISWSSNDYQIGKISDYIIEFIECTVGAENLNWEYHRNSLPKERLERFFSVGSKGIFILTELFAFIAGVLIGVTHPKENTVGELSIAIIFSLACFLATLLLLTLYRRSTIATSPRIREKRTSEDHSAWTLHAGGTSHSPRFSSLSSYWYSRETILNPTDFFFWLFHCVAIQNLKTQD